ncbi:Cu-processing system permease protein [Novimethylophilus kurashikiensis]|uniref:Cu-processing system permease protein n=1 Tax=Novimethylophilus kurashikiensis TaxID=1825523 RepID=A0A2R5F974_9PROT|nr:ABC transporter permease subunit [Novimethylophilus kurashikiensis]GBG14747.1 Cu-processing system permease protein [Novimethylophilus kurashikiensis]
MIEFGQIRVIARKEFRDRIRNRWVIAVSVIFTLFALAIAYLGAAQQGEVGLRSVEFTIASLVSLVIYLLPLIALILGYDAIVGERERGSLDLLLSMPITRLELLLGKFCGLSAALSVSTLLGFGLVGALLVSHGGVAALFHYAGFMLSAILLGMVFLSLAVMVSVFAKDRARASGGAIAVWFLFVLVFDLALLGALVFSGGAFGEQLFPFLLLLNPTDVFRILNIFSADDIRAFYGLATVFPASLSNPWLLGGVMLAWMIAPLSLAYWRFK